jgi:hypothetical protein
MLCPFGIFYGHLDYFGVLWYILPALLCCTKKNLAILDTNRIGQVFNFLEVFSSCEILSKQISTTRHVNDPRAPKYSKYYQIRDEELIGKLTA